MATHNLSQTKIYQTFWGMLNRCYYVSNKAYQDYGGRGIIVCEEWRGFENFLNFYKWAISNGYQEGLQLDRIDSNGNYEPLNCRWVKTVTNCRNQRVRKDNTSGFKGINFDKKKNLWVARISVDKKRIYLGRFKDLSDAIKARKLAEEKYWNVNEDIV